MSGLGLRAIGLAGLAAVGGALVYAAWRTYLSTPRPPTRRAPQKEEEERREGAKPAPEPRFQVKTLKKQVLILGLDGAGKTSILHSLATNRVQRCSTPTQGFNAVCINTEGGQLDFLEIGGSEPFRSYWNMYLSSGLVLIFVVDLSRVPAGFPAAKKHLHQLIQKDVSLPLVVLANKQDLEGASFITDIHDALELSAIGDQRKLFLIGTPTWPRAVPTSLPVMRDAWDLITQLVSEGPLTQCEQLPHQSSERKP
ncbi:LOW QUALITY PROTEIN: ADP-ribosylation factor-like protein 9 [Ornithorhynchus anatinus]|uniref:LOW QUALITY PROTEIN: ADP-ribosylation factor-like protein 9 n=1 Tax=Ornithorhynchus anatinus TaxID=9258 RepID=UPI0010A8F80D|nr:LOW QUALITY PROTEIN: ADP-ribosylation factor-like protein 9 [Ornithorhynchus anatinus]